MKSLKNYGLALVAMLVMLTAANAQSRYKHVPRVKVDKNYTEKTTVKEKKTAPVITTTTYESTAETTPVATETPVVTETENTTVASTTEDVVVVNHKTKNVVKHDKVVKTNKKANHEQFTNKVKNNSKLMDVKDVKKTAMERWVLIMIILYAVGIVFLILAFVFLFAVYSLALYYVFLIIGVLCLLAASIILPLGLAGVI